MERRLTWYLVGWTTFALAANALGAAGIVLIAPTASEGFANLGAVFTPPQMLAWGFEALLIAPLVVAWRWRSRLRAGTTPSRYASD